MAQWLILASDPKTAVVGTFHILPLGWMSRWGNRGLGIWLRPSLKRFDKMLAVSPAAAEFCLKSFGLKAEVVPNVINFQLYFNAPPLPKYQDGKLNILFLGRLVPRKGCLLLLEAVAELKKTQSDLPDFRVIICGRGHLEKKLRHFADQHGLRDIVEFAGFVSEDDKPSYYASADLAVFPSKGGESFGIVLLEAMANGRAAVLAGDNPGYHSVMESQPDLLFNPNSPPELAEKLARYIKNAEVRKQMAEWGSNYTKNFDTAVVGQKLVSIYEEALRKRRQL
jgi:phosphatidylinositol alpha-mannosyltransferase